MRSGWRIAAIALALLGAPAPAHAQAEDDPAAEGQAGDAVRSPEIVVTAPAIREMVRSFVDEVSTGGQQDQLARWDRTLCPGVAGMRRRYAQALNDRLAAIAYSVGLNIGEPGCQPNALIFVTEDSDALAQELVHEHRSLVSWRNRTGNTRGRQALQDFAATPRPIRWWHVTQTVTADGFVVRNGEQVAVRYGGRTRRATRQDFNRVIVIVDARRIDGIRFGAVADYVAMAVLAQLDPEAETREAPSILNLFRAEAAARPRTITEWDLAYLRGLYAMTRDARDADNQEREIARQMGEEVTEETLEEPEG